MIKIIRFLTFFRQNRGFLNAQCVFFRSLRMAAEVIMDSPAALQVLTRSSRHHHYQHHQCHITISFWQIINVVLQSTYSTYFSFSLSPIHIQQLLYPISKYYQLRYLQTLNSISAEHNSTVSHQNGLRMYWKIW